MSARILTENDKIKCPHGGELILKGKGNPSLKINGIPIGFL